ncbi:ATP-binding protein [Neisseriaceae bacterium B1]
MRRFLFFCGIAAFAVLYFLTLSTDINSRYAPYFWVIASTAAALALCLFVVVSRYIWLILRDKNNRVFGSQIARRLSLMFMLVAMLPALFLLGVSMQFISHSIDSWFGDDTKQALERSLNLSKNALNASVRRANDDAEVVKTHLLAASMQPEIPVDRVLHTSEARKFAHLMVWQLNDKPRVMAEANTHNLPAPELDNATLAKIRAGENPNGVEQIKGVLMSHGWLILPKQGEVQLALFFRLPVPENVAKDAQLIEAAWGKYAELVFAKKGLQTFFLITLAVAALLAIVLALAAALYFARKFVEPILLLATGARAVAQGDFNQRIVAVNQKDELGKLTSIFNDMTSELARAKAADEQHRLEQEAARHFLERVLNSLSAGVMTLDVSGCLKTFNHSAEAILDVPLEPLSGSLPESWQTQSPQHHELSLVLQEFLATESGDKAVEVDYLARDESRILLGKAIRLPEENGSGIVLVFDDITALVHAQKEAAWGEVAKRLAHEIRNPLTPIQLSAERLAWKLHDKLDLTDAQILTKSTNTIIKQVEALKEMVEAFRNYARAPSLNLTEINLNALIDDVLLLYENNECTFNAKLSKLTTSIKADSTAMRQVLHNLFKNAAEAAEIAPQPQVEVQTETTENGMIRLTVCNNGKNFSKEMLKTAFEPYITDKPTGTGLGLPVVKKIIEEHGGRISLGNRAEEGACVTVELPAINQ